MANMQGRLLLSETWNKRDTINYYKEPKTNLNYKPCRWVFAAVPTDGMGTPESSLHLLKSYRLKFRILTLFP